MIVVRMRKGLPKADKDRIYHEAVYALGPDRGLAGSRHWLDTDVIELPDPHDLDLALGEYYAMMRKLSGIDGVISVYVDNGVWSPPGGGQPSAEPPRGGIREFIKSFLGSSRLGDI